MDFVANTTVFQAYAASAVVLALNLQYLASFTAITRTGAQEVVNPEDREKLNKEAEVVFEQGNQTTARYKRAHRNALENIPTFLITALLLTFTAVPATLAMVLFGVFVVARLLHSLLYIRAVQPLRTAAFAIGFLDQVAILGCLVFYLFFA